MTPVECEGGKKSSKRTFFDMNMNRGISLKLCLALIAGVLAFGSAGAQRATDEDRDKTKTKQAQAVSKEVYERIQKAQEMVDAKNYNGALKTLNSLYNPDKLTEYEQANVLNYIGFVYYNMDDTKNAIRTYEKMLAIPSLEPQQAKQTTFTMAQLLTMEEQYAKALNTLDKWFMLETNPPPDPFILRAQILYNLERYKDMVSPIESALRIARERNLAAEGELVRFAQFCVFPAGKLREGP